MTRVHRVAALAIAIALSAGLASAADVRKVADEIRIEATRPNDSPEGRPLPLATHWCSGAHWLAQGWGPATQMRLIEQGHHLLPWFYHPPLSGKAARFVNEKLTDDELFTRYFEQPIKRAAALKLPIGFTASQWESHLSGKPYVDLPADQNPNVVAPDGTIQKRVSPFGPVGPWRALGARWTSTPRMKQLQAWYPDPPLVLFLSNNEHHKLQWHKAETSKRYLDAHGKGKSDDFKRKVVGDGWIEHYRAIQQGFRDGLTSEQWRKHAMFVGYGACGPEFMGRWGGWPHYSLHTKGRITPWPLAWDGGSPSYYTHDWNPSTDYTVWSPQVEFQNLVFIHRQALKLNPKYWLEFSVWDGYDGPRREKRYPSPRTLYRLKGQTYGPARYGGYVQFGMWLLRPRAVREYRGWTFPADQGMPYFMAIVDAVDRVHVNPTLRQWWRKGTLVPNRAHKHHYQSGVPAEWQGEDRWFLLDANVNPSEYPWELFWEVRVFALALVQGEAPARQWLIYAHSPVKERKGVQVTIPGYRQIALDVSVGGSFYVVDEKTGGIKPVE